MVQRGYELDSGCLSGESQANAADSAISTSYCKQRLKKGRAIRDDIKTSVENLKQEIGGQMDGILAAEQIFFLHNLWTSFRGGRSRADRIFYGVTKNPNQNWYYKFFNKLIHFS